MKIIFTKPTLEKINLYIKHCDQEISGLGIGKLSQNKEYITVSDVKIWEQECTGASTEPVDNKNMINTVEEFIAEGAQMEDINIWWHSHVNMGVTFSSTDVNTINDWVNQRFMVAIVGNKKGEFNAMISVKNPLPYLIEDVTVQVERDPINNELDNAIMEEVKLKVKNKPIALPKQKDMWSETQSYYEKVSNNYLAYQADIGKATPIEKKNILETSAKLCMCIDCQNWLDGTKKKFPFKNHIYDDSLKLWEFNEKTIGQYDNQLDWETGYNTTKAKPYAI